jgi:GNAT superfamily N-acetyltransferase
VTTEPSLIDAYCDLVPRAAADTEEIGGFTLFVGRPGRTYYARPTNGSMSPPSRSDIDAVVRRQRELGVPQEFEWVHETSPLLGGIARDAGLSVRELPLMTLRAPGFAAVPNGYRIRVLPADDPSVPAALAAIGVAFGTPGTELGAVGTAERDSAIAGADDPGVQATNDQIRRGLFVLAAAECEGAGSVAGGSHSPRGAVTEITGVATLPAYRRRGLGAALTLALCADATGTGVELCFLSAGSDAVARVYARVGFVRIGTSCLAEPG